MQNFFLKALNFTKGIRQFYVAIEKEAGDDGIHSSVEPLNLEAEHKSVMADRSGRSIRFAISTRL